MSEWNLPVNSSVQKIEFQAENFSLFWKAFAQPERQDFHPLVMARSFVGMFELFEKLNLNMKGLLHTGQKIEKKTQEKLEGVFFSRTQLIRVRSRASMHFLDFQNQLFRELDSESIVDAHSQIIIQGDLCATQ